MKTTLEPGAYYLIDPCYAIPDDDWLEFLDAIKTFDKDSPESGVIGWDKAQIAWAHTAHGDGAYALVDKDYNEIGVVGVDSGLIALIPAWLMAQYLAPSDWAVMLEFENAVQVEVDDLNNWVIDEGKYRLNTSWDDELYKEG